MDEQDEIYQAFLEGYNSVPETDQKEQISGPPRYSINTANADECIGAIERDYQHSTRVVQPTSLVSFPRSVEQHLITNARPTQAVNTLATTSPELAALLVAKQLGYSEITIEDKDVTTTSILRKRAWIFGGDYWKDGESTTRVRTRKIKLT